MADSVENAPDPDSQEFLDNQNTVERQAPGKNADEAGNEPGVLPDEPPLVGEDLTQRAPKSD
ncbi:hypothetical protein EV383_0253 [Pseudonocardia sediminis]|uniref:Uncharacterized protein n=1 Tax=Pseudonocardia sediminis TaxID=1397368 RepID=A0A4Q7URQ3_PSEST|nr:hypothetical protein [Pseudonocardia sediminis]RZT83448.1 hypothetical protein EV383_0253 [Pseudonocardia sediminis]